MKVKIYGARGSLPLYKGENAVFGGNTACVRLDTAGRAVVIDCGSGLELLHADIVRNTAAPAPALDIFIGHLHIDHIIGLSTFAPIYKQENNIRIYTVSRDARPLNEQIFGIFRPPYWPVDLAALCKAELVEIAPDEPVRLGDSVTVTPFKLFHPDYTTGFRVEGRKTAVYMLDCEAEGNIDYLAGYCGNADAVIFDSMYMPEDLGRKRSWGHSSYEQGIELAERSGCKKMIFTHFDQDYTDAIISAVSGKAGVADKYIFARDGMELTI